MAAYNKFQDFVDQLGRGVHNFSAHAIKIYLSNEQPLVTDTVKTDIAEIAGGNGYTAGGTSITPTWSETSGTGTLQGVSLRITASGGSIGPFQFVVLFNDTPTSPLRPLIAWWDRGSALTLTDGDSFDIKFNNAAVGSAGNVFTLA
jgi:hypothetical protein